MFFFLVGGTAMKSGRLGTEGAMRPAFLELLNGKRLHWDNASLFWFCLCSHVFALLSCDDKQDNTPLPEIQRGLSAAPQKEQRRPRSCAVPEFGADAGAAMGQTSREESLLWVPCCRRAQTGKSHNRREHKSKFSWGFFKHNFFFKPVFTFIPENMRAWVYENRERERQRQREREGWRFTGRGGPSASNSFRAPRVLRAWERGELFFPAKKEQGSNNTVLQQKPRALQRQGLRPPGQGRDSTHRVYLEVRVSASVIPIKYTSGKLNVTVVIAQAAWRQANKCLDSRRLEKKRSYYYRFKLHHCQHSGLVQQHLIVDLFRNC